MSNYNCARGHGKIHRHLLQSNPLYIKVMTYKQANKQANKQKKQNGARRKVHLAASYMSPVYRGCH